MTEESDAVLYSTEGSVARITLNRPQKKNALNDALITGIERNSAKLVPQRKSGSC